MAIKEFYPKEEADRALTSKLHNRNTISKTLMPAPPHTHYLQEEADL